MVQIIANKFVEKARQSKNQFSSFDEYQNLSIYNYHTSPTTMSFTQVYIFNETKPTEVLENDGIKCDIIKIENPESKKFEHLWRRNDQSKNLAKEE